MVSRPLDMPAEVYLASKRMVAIGGVVFDTVVFAAPTVGDLSKPGFLEEMHMLAHTGALSGRSYCNTEDSELIAFWHSLCGGVEMVLRDSNRFAQSLKGSTDLSKFEKWDAWLAASPALRRQLWDNELEHTLLDIEVATHGEALYYNEKRIYWVCTCKMQTR